MTHELTTVWIIKRRILDLATEQWRNVYDSNSGKLITFDDQDQAQRYAETQLPNEICDLCRVELRAPAEEERSQ